MSEFLGIGRLDRRRFLGAVAAMGVGGFGLAACSRQPPVLTGNRSLDRIGVQLYTVRDRMQQDVAGTLQLIGEIGYDEVETAGYFGLSPAQFRELLDGSGLIAPAAHVQIGELRDGLNATLAAAETIGHQWLVVPWLDPAERTPDGYRRLAQDLNRAGAEAAGRGVRVAYHNHEFEFEPLDDGRSGYDLLLAETDPQLVDMELDIFWAAQAGEDPVAIFEAHPGRFRLCHVKDMADPDGSRQMVAVGRGDIDFQRIFASSDTAGLTHYFVEHDNPDDSIESIRTRYLHLQELTY